jgi:hypothetical protein
MYLYMYSTLLTYINDVRLLMTLTCSAIRRSILTAGCESLKKYLRTRGKPPSGVDAFEEETDEFTPMTALNSMDLNYTFREAAASGVLDMSEKRSNHT